MLCHTAMGSFLFHFCSSSCILLPILAGFKTEAALNEKDFPICSLPSEALVQRDRYGGQNSAAIKPSAEQSKA